MIDRNNLTIVVQGPLNKIGLDALSNYKKYGKVILSIWDNDKNSNLFTEKTNYLDGVKLIINKWPEKLIYYQRDNELMDNDGNIAAQTLSCLGAFKEVDTEYVIKFRCDEYFENLEPLIKRMESGKIVSSDRYARTNRRETERLYHLGDTFFGGPTKILLDSFILLKQLLEQKYFHTCLFHRGPWILSAEQKIYISIIKILEPEFDFNEATEIMKRYFDICPLNELAPFKINSSGWSKDFGIEYKDEWNPIKEDCITNINQINSWGVW